MGLGPMTESFWLRSQFVKPDGQREATSCHPSALDMTNGDDFRYE